MTTAQIIVELLKSILPTIFLVGGGAWILNLYAVNKFRKEKEIELIQSTKEKDIELTKFLKEKEIDLIRSVREKQYQTLDSLYILFANFMKLYRISSPATRMVDLKDDKTRTELLTKAIDAEAEVDALIIRIGCEFGSLPEIDEEYLKTLLGNLRQSVQLWRETFREGEPVVFGRHDHEDYVRFKRCFVKTAAFMAQQIYTRLDQPQIDTDKAWRLILDVFDNKYDKKSRGI